MSLSDPNTSLEEILAPFAGPEHNPFDTPEGKASTARNHELPRAMAERLEAERQRRPASGVQVEEAEG